MRTQRHRRRRFAGPYLITLYALIASSTSADLPDTALRINQNFNGSISPHASVHAWMFEHMNNSLSEFQYYETAIGLRFRAQLTLLAMSFFYRQSFSKQTGGDWNIEKSPSTNVELALNYPLLKIWNQVRFECRVTRKWTNLRIKNFLKLTLKRPDHPPFIAWEVFYENERRAVRLHRFFLGISADIIGNILSVYYIRFDLLKDDDWSLYRILFGFKIIFNFSLIET